MRQVDAVGAIELAQRRHRVATKLDVRAQLSPEQREKLDERRKSRQGGGHHGEGTGKGMKGKMGKGHGKRQARHRDACDCCDACLRRSGGADQED
jgi:hypothetical protein